MFLYLVQFAYCSDVRTIMHDAGSAIMGIGTAGGENRCGDAARPRSPRRSRRVRRRRHGHPAEHHRRQGPRPVRGQRRGGDNPERGRPQREHHLRRGDRRGMADEVRVTVIGTGFDHRPGRSSRREGRRGAAERPDRGPRIDDRQRSSLEISDDDIDVPPFLPALSAALGYDRLRARSPETDRPGSASTPRRVVGTFSICPKTADPPAGSSAIAAAINAADELVDYCRLAPSMPTSTRPPVRGALSIRRGRCRLYEAPSNGRAEHVRPVRRLAHGRDRDERAAGARAAPAPAVKRRARLEQGGAQYSVLCREDGGVLDDLFTYRLGPERYLTVTNAANHERDLAWFQLPRRRLPGREGDRPRRRLRDARRAGSGRARARAGDRRHAAAGANDARLGVDRRR